MDSACPRARLCYNHCVWRFSLQQYSAVFGIVVVALLLTATGVFAWTAPTQAPPNGNVAPPINTGTTDQVKNGGLSVNSFAAFGNAYAQGNTGIGILPSTVRLTVSTNAATILPIPPLEENRAAIAQFASGDNFPTRILIDTFGPFAAGIAMRKANGTAVAPAALKKDDAIANLAGFGWGSTAYSSSARANIRFQAAENWTDTAQGTYIMFETSRNGYAEQVERMRLDPSGSLGIGTPTPTAKLTIQGDGVNSNFRILDSSGYVRMGMGSLYGLSMNDASNNSVTNLSTSGGISFINATGGNVGIGTAAPAARLDVAGSVKVGNGGEACSSSIAGTVRYNSTTQSMEFCNGSAWKTLATTN